MRVRMYMHDVGHACIASSDLFVQVVLKELKLFLLGTGSRRSTKLSRQAGGSQS